jgi:ParB-like chromosome segregation protein Spo0J
LKIKNRIRELRTVKAAELTPNPKNWRTHPKAQQDALRGILAEVGYADALLARELPDGSLMLVDGHLRAEATPDQEVPVLVLDINEAEADKLLLSLDPLAALAETNAQALDALLREVDTGSEGLQQMYADLAEAAKLYDADSPPPESSAKEIDTDEFAMQCKCPRCGFEFDPPKA